MSVPTNLIPTPITGLPEYTGSSTLGYMPYVIDGQTFKVQFTNIAAVGAVPSTRVIASGTGLAGGGDLSADRVISIAAGGVGVNQLSLTGVTAGTYGSGSDVPVLTVDATGRVTSATTAALSVTGFVPTSRTITAGNGLTGGGSLASDITLSANFSATTPLALGSATAGVAITLSRGDHVHPALDLSDTNQTQGALPLGRGGTGDALSPVAGAVVYSTGTKFALSALGLAGQVLVSNGTGAPVWTTLTGTGTVTSVNASGGTTGLSFTGGPITTLGTLTLGGTLAIANGGTGAIDAPTALTNLGAYPASNPSGFTSNVGTVTSVSGTGTVSGLSLSGTVTSTGSLTLGGTLAVLPSNFASQTANTVLAAPNGSAGTPTFRAIVAADVPTLNQNTTGTASNVTGIVAVLNGGTGASVAGTARTNLLAAGSGANTDITSIALTTGTVSATPTSGTDIVNKLYADSIASGINFHQSVRLATAAALPANTYNNGASGVGATLTANANGALTVDGVAAVASNRILVKNEVTQANNGVYTVTQVGDGSTPYILTRATDFDSAGSGVDQIDAGDFFLVTAGSTQSNTSWVQQTPLPITVGTTAIVFTQFAAPVLYTAGTGLTLAGTVFSITNTGVAASTYGSASSVPVIAVNAQGQATSVTNTPIAIAATQITSGTFTVGQGGTGQTTYTDGQLLIGNTTGNTLTKATLTAGTNVTITNGSGAITINAADQFVGTVTSVSGTGTVSGLTLTGTVTTSGNLTLGGTLAVTASDFASQTAKTFLAAPNASAGVPSFRAIVAADVPTLNQNTTGTASNVTGTVAVGNGGTGTTTAFTAGSVVFAGASGVYSQDNANFFWDDTNNRLGIGTATPTAPLSVTQDNVAFRGQLSLQTASATNIAQITFYDQSTLSAQIYQSYGANKEINIVNPLAAGIALWTTNAERMRITSAGDVLAGLTSASGLTAGGGSIVANGVLMAKGALSDHQTNAGVLQYTGNITTIRSYGATASTGVIAFNTGGGGGSADTERMRITSAGDVGIGTTAPGAKFDVVNSGVSQIQIRNTSGTTKNTQLMFADNVGSKWRIGMDVATNNNTNNFQLYNDAASAAALTVDASSNVGIGTTSPSQRLDVSFEDTTTNRTNPVNVAAITATSTAAAGAPYTGFGPALVFRSESYDGTTYAGPRVRMAINDDSISTTAGSSLAFDVTATKGASPTQAMLINPSGNVGINTTAALGKLQVASAGAGASEIVASNTVSVERIHLISRNTAGNSYIQSQNSNCLVGTYDNYNMQFLTNNTERMRIDSSGNLLVGTTTADNKLTVSVSSASAAAGVASLVNPNDGAGTAADLDFVTHSSGTLATGRIRGVAVGADDYALAFSSYGSGGIAERMRITGPGAISLGSGTATENSLMVYPGGISGTPLRRGIKLAADPDGQFDFYINNNQNNSMFRWFNGNGSAELMRLAFNGDLLVGTTTAIQKLTIGSGSSTSSGINLRTTKTDFTIAPSNTDAGGVTLEVGWVAGGQGPLIFNLGGEKARIDSSGNLLVGTTSVGGSASNTARVNGGIFSTFNAENSIPNNTATTVATLPSGEAVYLVTTCLVNSADPSNFNETAIISVSQSTAVVSVLVNAGAMTVSVSGLNVQLTHGQGTTTACRVAILRLL